MTRAETFRRAAALLRGSRTSDFHRAVAALIEHEPCQGADEPTDIHARYCVPFYEARDAAARAYLGES